MKAILRNAVLAAGVASIAVLGVTPAAANHGRVHFTGTATIAKFGVGNSTGTATLNVNGEVHGKSVTNKTATATFTVNEPPGTCPETGTANGTVTGSADDGTSFSVTFAWSRVGNVAVISTTGAINGNGGAAFAVTSPVGNPCGASNVQAAVAGVLVGA